MSDQSHGQKKKDQEHLAARNWNRKTLTESSSVVAHSGRDLVDTIETYFREVTGCQRRNKSPELSWKWTHPDLLRHGSPFTYR